MVPTEATIIAEIEAVCETAPAYGYRRAGAELRHRGLVVNTKRVRRIMREQELQPRRRRRWVATTNSDHEGPIFPVAAEFEVHGSDPLWVADIAFVALGTGFAYLALAIVLGPMADEARSWMPGRAASSAARSTARPAPASSRPPRRRPSSTAASKAAVEHRRPLQGCVFHEPTGAGSTRPGPIARS